MQTIIKLLRSFRQAKKGVSNVIVVMLSLILIVMIVSNVILWSYQMNRLDWERIQENMEILNASRATASSWSTAQNEFAITQGSRIGGTYQDTKVLDGIYETFIEESDETTQVFYPSAYNTVGSTKYLSGTLANLQTDDGNYMTFRSYISATSITSKTDAFIAYRSNTLSGLNFPKNRLWDGDTTVWGGENEMATADSPVRWVRTAVCSKSERVLEKIVVTLSDDGYLDAYVFDGTSWTVTNDIGSTGTTANAYRCFDIAYEKTSGRALLVYSRGTTTNEIGYKIWTFDSGWSSENLLDLPYTTGRVNWLCLASAPGTRSGTADDNEIAMIYIDANVDVHGYAWTGSTWSLMEATAVWDDTAAIATEECLAVAYEQTSGRAMFIWSDATSTDFYYRIWDGLTLSDPTLLDIAAAGGVGNWVTLKSNPINNELLFTVVDGGSDLNTAYWSGSAWTIHAEHDASVDTNARRCADFDWEPTGSKGLLVWGTNTGRISYKTYTAPNTWSAQTNVRMGGSTHYWVQLRTNPRNISGDVKILGAVLDSNYDLGAISWNGTTFTVIGASTITNDTTTTNYECFELEFMEFGPPTEFTSEVEFTGTSNTEAWSQLTWTIDSSFTTTGVTVTFQLYNYTAEQYSTSGDGYITDTIETTDVTKNQTITVNPTNFRNATSNEWKVKIKGVKATSTPFDLKVDLVELEVKFRNAYSLSITGDFVLDTSKYTLSYIDYIELQVRFRASDAFEIWHLKAYNWTNGQYNDIDEIPATTEFENHTVNIINSWQSYVNDNGTLRVRFCDAAPDVNQTTIEIDFFGARTIINKTNFTLKNSGALTTHIVTIWIINQTHHERYNTDLFINAGEDLTYIRADIHLPENGFTVKIVTERGNIAVFVKD